MTFTSADHQQALHVLWLEFNVYDESPWDSFREYVLDSKLNFRKIWRNSILQDRQWKGSGQMSIEPSSTEFLGIQHNEMLVYSENHDRSALFIIHLLPVVNSNASNIQLLFFVLRKSGCCSSCCCFPQLFANNWLQLAPLHNRSRGGKPSQMS